MKQSYIYTTLIFLFVSVLSVTAQDLNYTLSSPSVTFENQSIIVNSDFERTQNNLEWTQHGTINDITNFTITSTTESWNTTTHSGVLSHTLVFEHLTGQFEVVNTNGVLTATLSLTDTNTQELEVYTFTITNITYQ